MKFLSGQINKIPPLPGIYKFYSSENLLLYVGKAKNLKNRVKSYFTDDYKDFKTSNLISKIEYIETIPVASEFEALLLEAKLIKECQPKYNILLKDDKHYIYIKITKEKFPKVLFARKPDLKDEFFGPFPSSAIVKDILSYIRSIFPYCTQGEKAKRVCFYHHIGLCNPCPTEIVKGTKNYRRLHFMYKRNIKHIREILYGEIGKVKKHILSQMTILSKNQNYEEAAIYRNKLTQLEYLTSNYTSPESYFRNPKLLTEIRTNEEKELIKTLKPYFPKIRKLNHIECYDISNISGKLTTGSMVTFKMGEPDKNFYRRFRIKRKSTPDDFASLSEMMMRRLNHLEWDYPDLLVIDGGKPQLASLIKVMNSLKVEIPIIGLAKLFEEIVIPYKGIYIKISLASNSGALNLVKRLRDEAHRFAHNYHSLLRIKHLISPDNLN